MILVFITTAFAVFTTVKGAGLWRDPQATPRHRRLTVACIVVCWAMVAGTLAVVAEVIPGRV